jgi:two-component system OmpR family sensor kinase
MTRPRSLTRWLIVTLTVGAVAVWLLAASLAANSLRLSLDDAFDGGLRETAERLLPLAIDGYRDELGENEGEHDAHEIPLFDDAASEYIVYQVRRASGELLLRSHDAPAEPLDAPLETGFTNLGPWRIYTLGTQRHDVFIQVAEAIDHRTQSLVASVLALIWPIALLIPLSGFGIYLAVRRGIRPVRTLSSEIGARHAANLTPIEVEGLPIELKPIGDAVDGLILRVQTALNAERAFAANSAHELRTPLAGSLAQLQRLIAELEGHPEQERARQVEQSLVRLRQISDRLLQLARAEAGMARASHPTDVLPALRVVVEDARRRLPPGRDLTMKEGAARLLAPIDIDAFGIAMRNLIDNAISYSAASTPIEVVQTGTGVEVRNSGPLIPAEKLAGLTQRFARASSRPEGTGLGLSIVDTIMTQTGGRLVLASPAPGRADGFSARLEWPTAAAT